MFKWIVLGVVLLLLIWFLARFIESSSPFGFAKALARVQLKCFYIWRRKFPDRPLKEIYYLALHRRPGYDPLEVAELVNLAEAASNECKKPFTLREVVLHLAAHEFVRRTGSTDIPMQELRAGVESAIPEDV